MLALRTRWAVSGIDDLVLVLRCRSLVQLVELAFGSGYVLVHGFIVTGSQRVMCVNEVIRVLLVLLGDR
jgi:hypothetical protein